MKTTSSTSVSAGVTEADPETYTGIIRRDLIQSCSRARDLAQGCAAGSVRPAAAPGRGSVRRQPKNMRIKAIWAARAAALRWPRHPPTRQSASIVLIAGFNQASIPVQLANQAFGIAVIRRQAMRVARQSAARVVAQDHGCDMTHDVRRGDTILR